MAPAETSLGGPRGDFPVTHWTHLLRLRDPSDPQYRHHLDRLAQEYWRPCYQYVRRCWHMAVEDAKDLTQEFFAQFLEKDYLQTMDPGKGSFRGYLRTALFHFMSKAKRHERARRPREGARLIQFQEGADFDPPSDDLTPEQVFDRAWGEDVLRKAVQELKSLLETMGKTAYLQAFDRYYGDARPGYAEVASAIGVKESDVRNYLTFARGLLRRIIVERVRGYVVSEDELDAEVASILT